MTNEQRVLVTGGTGKLGRVIAAHLVRTGWSVIVTARDAARAIALADELAKIQDKVLAKGHGKRVLGIGLDFLIPHAVDRVLTDLSLHACTPTHLVNNARSMDTLAVKPDGTTDRETFLSEMDLDVVQPYRLTMALANSPDSRLSTVVNIGSQYGEVAPNPALYGGTLSLSPIQYGVSKAALHHMTRELAVRLAPRVRVNCVAFGGFSGRTDPVFAKRYGALSPNGRMLSETEAAGPVAFLLGEESGSVNGHVLVADGGWSIW